MLAAVAGDAGAGIEAAGDVEQADDRQRPAGDGRRQAAQIDFARQVRDQEGNVEAAGEEAGVQQAIAGVGERLPDAGPQARSAGRAGGLAGRVRWRAWRDASDQRQRGENNAGKRPQGAEPAQDQDQLLQDRGEDELAEGAAGVDDARGGRSRFERQAGGGGADQYREAAGARADGGEQAEGDAEPRRRIHQWREGAAGGEQEQAAKQHRAGAVAVRERTRDGLRDPPHQLADGEREAERGDAEPGAGVDRREEQAEGLAGAHRHHQQSGSRQGDAGKRRVGKGTKHRQDSGGGRFENGFCVEFRFQGKVPGAPMWMGDRFWSPDNVKICSAYAGARLGRSKMKPSSSVRESAPCRSRFCPRRPRPMLIHC